MSRLRVNKFDVQVVWPNYGSKQWSSRMYRNLTPMAVAKNLRWYADVITKTDEWLRRAKAKGAAK